MPHFTLKNFADPKSRLHLRVSRRNLKTTMSLFIGLQSKGLQPSFCQSPAPRGWEWTDLPPLASRSPTPGLYDNRRAKTAFVPLAANGMREMTNEKLWDFGDGLWKTKGLSISVVSRRWLINNTASRGEVPRDTCVNPVHEKLVISTQKKLLISKGYRIFFFFFL